MQYGRYSCEVTNITVTVNLYVCAQSVMLNYSCFFSSVEVEDEWKSRRFPFRILKNTNGWKFGFMVSFALSYLYQKNSSPCVPSAVVKLSADVLETRYSKSLFLLFYAWNFQSTQKKKKKHILEQYCLKERKESLCLWSGGILYGIQS